MQVVPQTEVRLLSNVPLNQSYEHQMTFTDKTAQASYFTGKSSYTFTDFTYVKEDGTVKVPRSRDSLYACNYMMFKNTDFSGKWFYAFVTRLEYVNPETTKIHFEIDVYQTWQFDLTFKPSFVEREHCKRWNADGSPVINTVDEGLHYGTDYDNVSTVQYLPNNGVKFLVVVSKEVLHSGATGIEATLIGGVPQPLTYYITPFTFDEGSVTAVVGGTTQPITAPTRVIQELYKNTKAVNNIVSMYVTEYTGLPVTVSGSNPRIVTFTGSGQVEAVVVAGSIYTLKVKKVNRFSPLYAEIASDKYSGFETVTESKLLMYPYALTIIDDFKGNRIELKNEYLSGKNININMKGSLGTTQKTSINIPDYNHRQEDGQRGETSLESALINNNANDIPIVNEFLAAYLQGNKNALETQKSSIFVNGILGGSSAILGAVGGGLIGGAPGAVAGGALGIGQTASNTYFQVKDLESKIKDIQNTPAQLAKMGSNTSYDVGNGYDGVWIIKKQIKPEYRKKLSDYFKMFGYKVHEVKVPNLKTRQHFNFVKTIGASIQGNVPQDDLATIKSMFDKGVTLWHTTDVGNYSLSNGEI